MNRRTLYRAWSRGGRSGLLDAFDCPDPSSTAPKRPVTTTPLQALTMMNNAQVLYLADVMAGRLTREAGPDVGRQVDLGYRLAFDREPTAEERSRAVRVVGAVRGIDFGSGDLQQRRVPLSRLIDRSIGGSLFHGSSGILLLGPRRSGQRRRPPR